jgi:oxysterol-binding protein 1
LTFEWLFCEFKYLQISSFRESKSDDRRFYLITPAKTLQLRTDSANERAAWIEALVSARAESSPDGGLLTNQNDASFSTERLRNRMHEEGLGEEIIKDCEQIVHSEFSQYHTQMKQRCEEYVSFLSRLPQQFEVTFMQYMPIRILIDSQFTPLSFI